MWRDALFLSWADFRIMLRAREIWLWAFVMPVVFFYFIGTITGGSGGAGDAPDTLGLYAPADAGFLTEQLVSRLEDRHFRVERVDRPEDLEAYSRRVTVPAGFTASILAGKPVTVRATRRAEGLGGDYEDLRLARAVYTVLADLVLVTKDGGTATPEAFAGLAERPRPLTLRRESAGRRKEIPSGFQQSVPGSMVFLVLIVLSTSGATLVIERERGILRRLASAPMSRGAVVLGKWGARVLLASVQVAFAVAAGAVLFGVRWGPHVLTVGAVLLAFVALAAALGMLVGNYGRTPGQVVAGGVIASNLLAGLGGCWWPIEVTPAWSQRLAALLPTGWVMDALHQLLSFGAGPTAVLPHLAALTAAAAAAGWLVARRFRFQ